MKLFYNLVEIEASLQKIDKLLADTCISLIKGNTNQFCLVKNICLYTLKLNLNF